MWPNHTLSLHFSSVFPSPDPLVSLYSSSCAALLCLSLSLASNLSHALPRFLSLTTTPLIVMFLSSICCTPRTMMTRSLQYLRCQLSSSPNASMAVHDEPRRKQCSNGSQWLFLMAILGAVVFSIASYSRWYPPFPTKVPESLACIFVQKWQTLQVDLNQTEPYFDVTIPNLYLWKKMLSNYI